MAIPGSKTLHDVALKGHTIGSHTWSHPRTMRSLRLEDIKAEIEMGSGNEAVEQRPYEG